MTVFVITTGGTIGAMPYKDLRRQPKIKTMPAKGQDFVRAALQKIPNVKTRCVPMEARDSSNIDEAYRKELVQNIKQAPETYILVSHGTDTIIETAGYLYKQQTLDTALRAKTIVLVGAMVALSCGAESDGLPNLRFALQRLNEGQMRPGVYIVLSDYQEPETKSGWAPRLYRFEPGQYKKLYNPEDDRRNRIQRI